MTLPRSRARESRCAGVIAACAVIALAQVATAPSASADHREGRPGERSKPCARAGEDLRYVVLFDKGTSRARADRAITRACGERTIYYPSISVGVATSHDPSFAERIAPAEAFSAQGARLAKREQRVDGSQHQSDGEWPTARRPRLPPTDPAEVSRSDRTDEQWDMRMINADLTSAVTKGEPEVVVGVLDSGIDAAHPELADAVDPELSAGCLTGEAATGERAWKPTTSAHGTQVAGTIAAAADGAGITGVAPGVRLASIKVIDDSGYVDPEAVVCGLMWAAKHDMRVTNSSYFIDPESLSCAARDDLGVAREVIARAGEYATSAGTLNVAAATNEAVNLSPAASRGAASVPPEDRKSVV